MYKFSILNLIFYIEYTTSLLIGKDLTTRKVWGEIARGVYLLGCEKDIYIVGCYDLICQSFKIYIY